MATGRNGVILVAAEQLFAERGFHAVGMAELGAAAGVTGSAIYRHFVSKDEILASLFEEASVELVDRLRPPSTDLREELEGLVDAHLDFTLDRRSLALIWLHEQRSLTAVHRDTFLRRRDRYVKRWLDVLIELHAGVPRPALIAAMNAAQTGLMSVALLPRIDDPAIVRDFVRAQTLAGLESLGRLTVAS